MTGVMTLDEASLGPLELSCENGYIVTGFDLGMPEYRVVSRYRSMTHGTEDETKFLGARAVTLSVMLDHRVGPIQTLLSRLARYQSPKRRPSLTWQLPESTDMRQFRSLSPRGVPVTIGQPKYNTFACQWVSADPLMKSPEVECVFINPAGDTESGRPYNENYADGGRGPYPTITGIGARLVTNQGDEDSDWTVQLFGPCVNPAVRVNGVTVSMTANGGQSLLAGESIVIDTYTKTILLNGDPTLSRYGKSNFVDWSWESLLLAPGDNSVRISAVSGAVTGQFCWDPGWLA